MKVQNMNEPIAGAAAGMAEPASTIAAKAAPPVAVVGAHVAGLTLPDLVQIATLAYLALMFAHQVWRWRKELRTGKLTPDSEDPLP